MKHNSTSLCHPEVDVVVCNRGDSQRWRIESHVETLATTLYSTHFAAVLKAQGGWFRVRAKSISMTSLGTHHSICFGAIWILGLERDPKP